MRREYYGVYLGLGGNERKLEKRALFIRHESDQVSEAEMGKYEHVKRMDDMGNVSRISGKT